MAGIKVNEPGGSFAAAKRDLQSMKGHACVPKDTPLKLLDSNRELSFNGKACSATFALPNPQDQVSLSYRHNSTEVSGLMNTPTGTRSIRHFHQEGVIEDCYAPSPGARVCESYRELGF